MYRDSNQPLRWALAEIKKVLISNTFVQSVLFLLYSYFLMLPKADNWDQMDCLLEAASKVRCDASQFLLEAVHAMYRGLPLRGERA